MYEYRVSLNCGAPSMQVKDSSDPVKRQNGKHNIFKNMLQDILYVDLTVGRGGLRRINKTCWAHHNYRYIRRRHIGIFI